MGHQNFMHPLKNLKLTSGGHQRIEDQFKIKRTRFKPRGGG